LDQTAYTTCLGMYRVIFVVYLVRQPFSREDTAAADTFTERSFSGSFLPAACLVCIAFSLGNYKTTWQLSAPPRSQGPCHEYEYSVKCCDKMSAPAASGHRNAAYGFGGPRFPGTSPSHPALALHLHQNVDGLPGAKLELGGLSTTWKKILLSRDGGVGAWRWVTYRSIAGGETGHFAGAQRSEK
jgi:hypothetical protein